jgi:hypothetical protein
MEDLEINEFKIKIEISYKKYYIVNESLVEAYIVIYFINYIL